MKSASSTISGETFAWRSRESRIGTSGPDRAAHAAQELALAVVVALRRHGAVQLQEDGVGALAPSGRSTMRAGHALEGVVRDAPARHGAGPGERDQRDDRRPPPPP